MPRMRAKQSHGWLQGSVKAGDEYDATPQESELLTALGWSQVVAPTYQTRAMTHAAPQPSAPQNRIAGNRTQRRQIARRDMTAES